MAIIYNLDIETLALKKMSKIINNEYVDALFEVFNKDEWTEIDLQSMKSKSSGYDVIKIESRTFMEPHYHTDNEQRLILSGVGYFYIPTLTELFIIEASAGDYVSLSSNIVHWFDCKKNTIAARFFEGSDTHKQIMKDIPHEIYRLKDSFDKGIMMNV